MEDERNIIHSFPHTYFFPDGLEVGASDLLLTPTFLTLRLVYKRQQAVGAGGGILSSPGTKQQTEGKDGGEDTMMLEMRKQSCHKRGKNSRHNQHCFLSDVGFFSAA